MNTLHEAIELVRNGQKLGRRKIAAVFNLLLASSDETEITELLKVWANKGATASELSVCAGILRNNALRVDTLRQGLLDIVGTGGSRVKLFNISTASAFVAAGAGVPVAKHGNRAATSKTGSADALKDLGVDIADDPHNAGRILDEIGICFMFAAKFHRLKSQLASARKALGAPTIFNQLGPLANPASAPFQIIGVWSPDIVGTMAKAVAKLGTHKTWIVHGHDGLDELTLSGKTRVAEVADGKVREFDVSPEDFGLEHRSLDGFKNVSAEESAAIVTTVLHGLETGSASHIVLLNAAAAIYVAGHAKDLRRGLQLARDSIESGAAAKKLAALVKETNK